jgi:hypothetical protein
VSIDKKLLTRIRALLAEAYNGKASELLAQYGIDAALIAAKEPTSDQAIDKIITIDAPYARDKQSLLLAVASPLRCKTVRITGRRTAQTHLFGMASDVERVELLYTSLLVQASLGLATARPSTPWEDVRAFRRTWMSGFSGTVRDRLWVAERKAQREAETREEPTTVGGDTSVALVLADRTSLVEAAYDAAYPKESVTMGRGRRLSGSGYGAGREAGKRADLGGTRLGGGSRRAVAR